jgi:flagellar biosynthesis protein FliR
MFDSSSLDIMQFPLFNMIMIFVRLGAMFMILPGIGDAHVQKRTRVLFALSISILLASHIKIIIPSETINQLMILFFEMVAGFLMGLLCRIIMSSLQLAGQIFAMQSSLSAATIFDRDFSEQESIFGSFLYLLAVTLFFSMEMDHLLIKYFIDSYNILNISNVNVSNDITNVTISFISKSFLWGIKFAAPIIILSMILNIGAGILSKLMPSIQVFFILTPLQILTSFLVLFLILVNSMEWYMNEIIIYFSNLLGA